MDMVGRGLQVVAGLPDGRSGLLAPLPGSSTGVCCGPPQIAHSRGLRVRTNSIWALAGFAAARIASIQVAGKPPIGATELLGRLQQHTMADQLLAAVAALQALPVVAQVAVALGSTLLLAVCLRLLKHTVLRGSAPPVEEGIPFIGGLLKFAKVRGGRWRSTVGLPRRRRQRWGRLPPVRGLPGRCARPARLPHPRAVLPPP